MRFKTFVEDLAANKKLIADRKDQAAIALYDGFKKTLDEIIKSRKILYRGADANGQKKMRFENGAGEYFISTAKVLGRTEPRKSLTSDDTMMNIASGWKGYPERRFSTFTTQNLYHASRFDGDIAIVIPADSTKKFGWMPEDFNESEKAGPVKKHKAKFERVVIRMRWVLSNTGDIIRAAEVNKNDFKTKIAELATKSGIFEELKSSGNRIQIGKDKIKNMAAFLDSLLKQHKQLKELAKAAKDRTMYMDAVYDLMELLEENGWSTVKEALSEVNPDSYHAQLLNSISKIPDTDTYSECWFEGDYLLVFLGPVAGSDVDEQIEMLKAIRAKLN